ncbi:unnamed protein product [Lymnaea stagnalis]|uniref:SRCR domain-containing protein n=1 Tax=Lymnaea stagnalis TaxID=6523 RepID=A0AAV2GWY5_LYMST
MMDTQKSSLYKRGIPFISATLAALLSISGGGVHGLSCYSCSITSDPTSCTTLQECSSGSQCFTEMIKEGMAGDLHDFYNMGCEKNQPCDFNNTGEIIGRRRGQGSEDIFYRSRRDVMCKKCCNTTNCNLNLCTATTVPPFTPFAPNIYLRLAPSSYQNNFEGIIEAYYDNRWGTICSDQWSVMNAKVVCGMLGFPGAGATTKNGSLLSATVQQNLPNIMCSGNESSIVDCHHGPVGNHSCLQTQDAGVTCSLENTEDDIMFLLDKSNNKIARLDVRTQSYGYIEMEYSFYPGPLDYDPVEERLYFAEGVFNQIISTRFDGSDIRNVLDSTLTSRGENLRLDPVNRKLFIVIDALVSVNLDGTGYKRLITTDIDGLRGLAVHPATQTVFFSNVGNPPKLESSHYDGSNRTVLVRTNISYPQTIAIDYTTNTLYYADTQLGTIVSMDLHGNGRKVIYQDSSTHIYCIDVFGDFIYFTDWTKKTPMRVHLNGTSLQPVGAPSFNLPTQIRLFSKHRSEVPGTVTKSAFSFDPAQVFVRLIGVSDWTSGQIQVYNNGRWGSVCDGGWNDQDAQVACHVLGFNRTQAKAQTTHQKPSGGGLGMSSLDLVNCTGQEDQLAHCGTEPHHWDLHDCSQSGLAGATCETPGALVPKFDNFIVFYDVSYQQLVKIDLNYPSSVASPTKLNIEKVSIGYVPDDQKIYFSGDQDGTFDIWVANRTGSVMKSFGSAIPAGSVIEGLSADKAKNILVYTDSGHGAVVAIALDGTGLKNISTGISEPKGLALDKRHGVVYWSDCKYPAKIEGSNYDGSNRRTLLNSSLESPNAIAIDADAGLVYFCDDGTKTIEVVNTSGRSRKVLHRDYRSQCSGVSLTSKYIYYSDSAERNIVRLNRDGSHQMPLGPDKMTSIYGLFAFENKFT